MNSKISLGLWGILLALVAGFYVLGGSTEQKKIQQLEQVVEQQITTLEKSLEEGSLRNALILKTYADQLKKQKPELAPLSDNLAKDATPKGTAFMRLRERLEKVKNNPESLGGKEQIVAELMALQMATDPSRFNDALVDSVNTLADLSGGALSRLHTAEANGGANPPGSQLVGNPQYGQWKQSNGMTFWEWYGAYALFRDVMGGRNYNYQDWARQRPNSYYGSQGRDFYSTPRERQHFNDNVQRKPKSYGQDNSGVTEPRRKSSFERNPSSYRRSSPSYSRSPAGRRSSSFGRRR